MKLKILVTLLFLLLPISTPAADIWLEARPFDEIKEISFECSKFNLSTLKVYLTSKTIPTKSYFHSVIYYYDLLGPVYYTAREAILKNYVFIRLDPGDPIRPQFYGTGFVLILGAWEDSSFYYVFKGSTCAQLKKCHFVLGFSTTPDLGGFKGAAFTFK